jgi:hypothetical protein
MTTAVRDGPWQRLQDQECERHVLTALGESSGHAVPSGEFDLIEASNFDSVGFKDYIQSPLAGRRRSRPRDEVDPRIHHRRALPRAQSARRATSRSRCRSSRHLGDHRQGARPQIYPREPDDRQAHRDAQGEVDGAITEAPARTMVKPFYAEQCDAGGRDPPPRHRFRGDRRDRDPARRLTYPTVLQELGGGRSAARLHRQGRLGAAAQAPPGDDHRQVMTLMWGASGLRIGCRHPEAARGRLPRRREPKEGEEPRPPEPRGASNPS